MSPLIPSILTIAVITFLFRRESRERPDVTAALWLPVIWLFLTMSRFVSQWLNMFGVPVTSASIEEGSPLDAFVFFVLIVAGVFVLAKRQVSVSELVRNNAWLTVFVFYGLLATLWSDFPLIAFKRWFKNLGLPIMVLVIFTEPNPKTALTQLIKRCAYVVVPISILFIKYYPEWGRRFSIWTGQPENVGIAIDKNALGWDCLIIGYFFIWHLLMTVRLPKSKFRTNELFLCVAFLSAVVWLLSIANSKTPLVSLFVGASIVLLIGMSWFNRRYVGTYLVVSGILFGTVLNSGGYETVLRFLGRNPTLTDRTFIWNQVMQVEINPLLGAGYETFWLGERMKQMLELTGMAELNQAHNGYLETYLNLGLAGLALLLVLLIATFWKARTALFTDFDMGRFRLGFLFAVILYNWTESSFKAMHPVWFAFYIIAIDYPRRTSCYSLRSRQRLERKQEVAQRKHQLVDQVEVLRTWCGAFLGAAWTCTISVNRCLINGFTQSFRHTAFRIGSLHRRQAPCSNDTLQPRVLRTGEACFRAGACYALHGAL